MKLLNLVVDKAESFSLMNEQNDYTAMKHYTNLIIEIVAKYNLLVEKS
jgi:hypothetical protein